MCGRPDSARCRSISPCQRRTPPRHPGWTPAPTTPPHAQPRPAWPHRWRCVPARAGGGWAATTRTGGRSRPWPRPGCRAARSRPRRSPRPGAGSRRPSRANGPRPGRARPPRRAAAPAPPGGAGGTGDQDHGLLHRVRRSSGYPPTSLPRTPIPTLGSRPPSPAAPHLSQVRQRDPAQPGTRHAPRGRTTRPSSNELLAVAEPHWPQPRLRTRAQRAGNAGWSAAPTGRGLTGHAARPSAWSTRSAGRDRAADDAPSAATPDHAKHQHHHDHDDQHPQPCRHGGLLGRRRGNSAVTLLPPTRASNSVTARRPPGPGSTAALRAGSRDPGTPRPARRSGLAGRPSRPRRPRWGRALPGHAQPAQPNHRPQHHTSGGPGQASTDPRRPQRPRPAGYGEAEKRLPCLGGGTMQAWLCRCAMARRRAVGAGPMVRAFGDTPNLRRGRLHRPALPVQPRSALRDHQGWDRQVVTRPRIRQQGHGRG